MKGSHRADRQGFTLAGRSFLALRAAYASGVSLAGAFETSGGRTALFLTLLMLSFTGAPEGGVLELLLALGVALLHAHLLRHRPLAPAVVPLAAAFVLFVAATLPAVVRVSDPDVLPPWIGLAQALAWSGGVIALLLAAMRLGPREPRGFQRRVGVALALMVLVVVPDQVFSGAQTLDLTFGDVTLGTSWEGYQGPALLVAAILLLGARHGLSKTPAPGHAPSPGP